MPNITHTALQDLITFIYCGEVNVKNEALSTFISTAESLQIKGLTDNDTPKADTADIITPQMITINSPPPQQSIPTPAPVAAPQQRATNVARSAPKRASRPVPVVTQKIESDDSGEEDHQPLIVRPPVTAPVVAAAPPAVKRQISSSSSSAAAPQKTYVNAAKRMKTVASTSTPNPAPNQTKKQKLQPQPEMIIMKHEEEPEVMIEMPMAEEEQEVEEEEEVAQESLIEDDQTYGDMKYDETYFTETEDNKTVATSYGGGASRSVADQSTMDTSNADHQG